VTVDRIPTCVRAYDAELGGGIPQGAIVLLRGGPGTMKSSLAYSLLRHNALQGRGGLFICLEQDGDVLLEQMAGMGLARPDGLTVLDLSRGRPQLEKLLAGEQGERGKPAVLFLRRLEALRREARFELLAIDSWNALELLLGFTDRRLESFEFFRGLRASKMTTFLISEPPAPGTSDFTEEFLADGVFYLKLEGVGELDYQRRIQCAKLRGTGHSQDFFTLVFEHGQFEVARAIG